MTQFGWDGSHYDGLLSTAILARAKDEGIAFFTHKVGEGTSYDDPNDLTALAAARNAGIECIGGYYVVRTGAVDPQVDNCLALADRDEPWWRDWPHWAWQVDLERWPYDNVAAATGVAFAKRLRDRSRKPVLLYASKGQYGDELTGWNGPLWNANYTSRAASGFKAMYPGDGGAGWAAYSGQIPVLWQFTSSATIAGLTTCDANAFRGSYDQLKALFRGDDMSQDYADLNMANFTEPPWMTGDIAAADVHRIVWTGEQTAWSKTDGKGTWLYKQLNGTPDKLAQIIALLQALQNGTPLVLTPEQVNSLGDLIGQRLVERPDNPLGEADKPAIVDAVKTALREGTAEPTS